MKAGSDAADYTACPMNYPGFVFRELHKMGYSAEALLEGTGLSVEGLHNPDAHIDLPTLRQFIMNAIRLSHDPHLGLRLALNFETHYIGPPAYAALSAPTLKDGLTVLKRFLHLTFPAFDFSFNEEAVVSQWGEAEIILSPKFPLEEISYFATGSALLVLNQLLKQMLRLPLVASHCEVTITEPSGFDEVSSLFIGVPVRFNGQENRIFFPSSLLDKSLPGADPINHQRMVAFCEQLTLDKAPFASPITQVLLFLENENNLGASLSQTALKLGYSERGLRRQLERFGTSYRKLIDQILEGRAKERLAKTSVPISTIAHELGYETPSNFARSFKRWTGETPKTFRERHRVS